ncbi:MAG TPA: hypothetical protein PL090_07770, partial [Syntrophales bacterium]|nr:hypothetical protein [Syntrophales bacterium]
LRHVPDVDDRDIQKLDDLPQGIGGIPIHGFPEGRKVPAGAESPARSGDHDGTRFIIVGRHLKSVNQLGEMFRIQGIERFGAIQRDRRDIFLFLKKQILKHISPHFSADGLGNGSTVGSSLDENGSLFQPLDEMERTFDNFRKAILDKDPRPVNPLSPSRGNGNCLDRAVKDE